MAYVILNGTVPQTQDVKQLKQSLVKAFYLATYMKKQLDQMSDQEVVDQFGVPLGAVAAFKSQVDSLVINLEAQTVQNFIASLAFTV